MFPFQGYQDEIDGPVKWRYEIKYVEGSKQKTLRRTRFNSEKEAENDYQIQYKRLKTEGKFLDI